LQRAGDVRRSQHRACERPFDGRHADDVWRQEREAAQIWSTLPAAVLSRTCFFHHGTYTVIHPDEGKVLRLMGAVAGGEMLPSMRLARARRGAWDRAAAADLAQRKLHEAVYFQGAPQPL